MKNMAVDLFRSTSIPSTSKAQQRLFQIAEHNPGALHKENKQLASLPHKTLHDFASGSEKGKPEHVSKRKSDYRRVYQVRNHGKAS